MQVHEIIETEAPPSEAPSGPLRYLIRCRRSRFEEKGRSDVQLVDKLVKRQRLDSTKTVHLATFKDPRRVHIIIDYDNPSHEKCAVRAFKGNSLKDIRIPDSAVDYIHSHVESFKRNIARGGVRFPFQCGDHVEMPPGWKKRGSIAEGDTEGLGESEKSGDAPRPGGGSGERMVDELGDLDKPTDDSNDADETS